MTKKLSLLLAALCAGSAMAAVDSAASRAVTAVRSMFSEENHWITIIDDIFEELFT